MLPAVVTDRVRPGNCFAPFHWNDLFGEYLSVNAVTDDAVDPLSFQPGFKMCAVTLARTRAPLPVAALPAGAGAGTGVGSGVGSGVAPGGPAGPRTPPGAATTTPARPVAAPATAALASLFGLEDHTPPALSDRERQYLAGFLAGLASAPPGPGVPSLPADAPFEAGHALWVDGVLAGTYARTATALAAAPRPLRPPLPPPRTGRPGRP